MLLRKEYITKETAQKFFPSLITDSEKYQYIIEVSALKISGKKTYQHLHISASREKHEGDYIMRELFIDAPCLRATLDKPTREGQREAIYATAKERLLARALTCGLASDHPYVTTLNAM